MEKRIAIQGYRGCFHEEAARNFYGPRESSPIAIVECATFDDLFGALSQGRADAAVMAIENTQQYQGLYHVLGGVISPIDGIGIRDLNIDTLIQRVQQGIPSHIEEVILALPTTMEGDTTAFYLNKQLAPLGVKITTIARGIAIGDNLEYADEITLGRSIVNRIPFA